MSNPQKLDIGDLLDYAPSECFDEDFPLYWQMARAERICLIHLLRAFKRALSLEVGTYKGGSLQVLCRYSTEIITVDIDPGVTTELAALFSNASFRCGDSNVVLPAEINEINHSDQHIAFVPIDGDHSENGVRRDIEAVLKLRPRRPICVVMHDSFHPPCRDGMRAVHWADCPHVHYVELDFVNGVFLPGRSSVEHSMYGGFALALLLPEKREFELEVFESQVYEFDIIRRFAGASGFLATASKRSLGSRIRSRLMRLVKKNASI